MIKKIKTKGMHCRSCELLIKEEIEELDGIKKVDASYESGVIFVEFDSSKVNLDEIIDCIKQEKYIIESVK
jgi:copper chaperone CopZ